MSGTQELTQHLRQMIAVLEDERQALAGLDVDAITKTQREKRVLCDCMDAVLLGGNDRPALDPTLDEECRALAQSAQRLNEVNRTVRNLMAANVAARLDALTGKPATYQVTSHRLNQA